MKLRKCLLKTLILRLLSSLGVRVNVPIDTLLLTLSATDLDTDAEPITYQLENLRFSRAAVELSENKTYFSLDNVTGELRTATSMTPFSDGHFTLAISASNSPNRTYASVKVINEWITV